MFNKTINPFSPSISNDWVLHYYLCFEEMSLNQFLVYHQINLYFSPMCQIEIEKTGNR